MKTFKILKRKRKPKNLTEYMKRNKIKTQRELARILDISESHLSRYFSGERDLGKKTINKIHERTRVPIIALWAGEK